MLSYSTLQTIIQLFRMVADILILWVLLYYSIKIVRNNSRTAQIFKGIILILIIRAIANFFGFKAVDWLAGILVTYGFLAIIIIFQPEIRTILERLGKNTFFSRLSTLSGNERERLVEELVTATMHLSSNRIGALITLEQGHSLSDFIKTGTPMNSLVTADLLTTIFLPNTPIHDGAVIIQGDRIACASAYFPPTNLIVPTRFGARHRAAIGISEITDSVTIVVSEKSGRVSIAEGGKLIPMNQAELKAYLHKTILHGEEEVHEVESPKVIVPIAPAQPSPEFITEEAVEEPKSLFKRLFTPQEKPMKAEEAVSTEETQVETAPEEVQVPEVKVEELQPEPVQTQPMPEPVVESAPQENVAERVVETPSFEPEHISHPVSEMANEEPLQETVVSQEMETQTPETAPKAKSGRRKKTEDPVVEQQPIVEPVIEDSPKPKKEGFFKRLFASKPKPSPDKTKTAEKTEEAASVAVPEEPLVAQETPVEKPKRSRKKKIAETPVSNEPDVKIKDTPHVKLEFSVSDESLLDDDFDAHSSKGGE